MIDLNQAELDRLKHEVEVLVGRVIKTPKDFDFLARQIEGYTDDTISVSTLKRIWGYVATQGNPSLYSLNLLSRMVGYPDWNSFSSGNGDVVSNRFFVKSKLMSEALLVGEEVRITWMPGRVLTVVYRGNELFEVRESVNSKLMVGDTFTCHQFVADEPLYLSNISHAGIPPCNYVAGLNGGIKWKCV